MLCVSCTSRKKSLSLTPLISISDEQSKHEIKETILFIIASKMIKHVGIDLIKVQNLYQENENIVERNFKRS